MTLWSVIASRYAKVSDDVRQVFLHPAIIDVVQGQCSKFEDCLDFGCGPGDLALGLEKLFVRLILVDQAVGALDECSGKFGSRAEILDPETFELHEGLFDAVILSLVLTTVEDDDEARCLLKKLCGRLKPDGRIIIGTTHPCFTFQALNQVPYHASGSPYRVVIEEGLEITEYHRPLDKIYNLLNEAGLSVVNTREVYDSIEYYQTKAEEPRRFAGQFPMFLVLTCCRAIVGPGQQMARPHEL
ncbi:MAG: class I SAM-dependent methyltransferase [Desulfuromonadaceae bacterium]